MKSELILRVQKIDDLSYLEPFGTVLFSDDIADIVIMECDNDRVTDLISHPFIYGVKETRTKGMMLET